MGTIAFRKPFSHDGFNVREHTPEGVEIAFNGQSEDDAREIANVLNGLCRELHEAKSNLAAFELVKEARNYRIKVDTMYDDPDAPVDWVELERLDKAANAALLESNKEVEHGNG